MKVVIQRVQHCNVSIANNIHSSIAAGLLVLVGITADDTADDINWLCQKIVALRIFNDEHGKMNYSIKDTQGDIMVVSQFTLMANCAKGNRPSYIAAAPPIVAAPMYTLFVSTIQQHLGKTIATGVFGADMQITFTNDGPVTICIDSKQRS